MNQYMANKCAEKMIYFYVIQLQMRSTRIFSSLNCFFLFLSGKYMPFTINNFLPMNWLTVLCCTFEIHGDGRLLIFIYDGIAFVTTFFICVFVIELKIEWKKARKYSLSLFLCLFSLCIFSIKNSINSMWPSLRFIIFFSVCTWELILSRHTA